MPRTVANRDVVDSTQAPCGHLDKTQIASIDCAIGAQIRFRRTFLGMSQGVVAKAMGLTFQQLQKYEQGTNRVSGSRLYQLGLILQVPVSYFFKTVEVGEPATASPSPAVAEADALPSNIMKKRRTVELVRAFYAIDDAKQRDSTLGLLKTLAGPGR